MSQAIRKFAEGGSVEKPKEPKLMNWEGVGDYDLNSIVATSIKNREGYLQHQNWGNKRAEGFNTALDFLVEGLGSGKIKRKSDGSFEIIGGGAESTGKYDRNFLGGIKNNTNTAYTDAASYLSNVMGSLSTYKAPVEEKKVDNTLKDYKFDLMGAVRDKTFGGGDWSDEGWEMQDTFDETTKSRGTANRQRILSEILRGQVKSIRENADFDKQYKGTSAFGTGADRATALEALAAKLEDGTLNDDDYKAAFAAGLGDIRGYFNSTPIVDNEEDRNSALKAKLQEQEYNEIQRRAAEHAFNTGATTEKPATDLYFNPKTRKEEWGTIKSGMFYPTKGEAFSLSGQEVGKQSKEEQNNKTSSEMSSFNREVANARTDFWNEPEVLKGQKWSLALDQWIPQVTKLTLGMGETADRLLNNIAKSTPTPVVEKGSIHDIRLEATRKLGEKVNNAAKVVDDYLSKVLYSNRKLPTDKKAEGGVIKAEEGTRVNVQSLNPNYNRGNFLGSEDVLSYFKGIKNSNDAANFNQREDIYDNEYTQAYGPGSLKSWNTNTHLATTKKDWGTGVLQNLWGKTGLNKNLWGSMGNGYGKTGDNPGGPYPDQLFGDITYQRTLGRGVDTKYADQINSILKESGMQYAPDTVHGGYRVTPLKPGGISIPTKAMTPASVGSMPTPKVSKFVKPDREETKPRNTLGLNTEDTIALGRMLGGLATNNRATAQYKEGLRPTLVDTYENYVPTTGDLYTKRAQYNQAAELDRMAATPMTSDSQHQLAGMFESRMKGNQLRTQGDLADSQMIRQTADLGRQEANAAKGRRTEVANQNRAQSNMINAAKSQIDSAKTTANYQQVLAPYLAGIENTYRQNTAMGKQYQAESDQQQLRLKYSGAYDTAQKDYYNATTDQQREAAIALKKKTDESYTKEAIDMRKNLGVTPWMFTKKSVPEYTITPTYAKGGKISETGKALLQSARDFNKRLLVDNTIFHRDIMESKREHNKLIASMSSLTASLIKNGMSWK